MDDTDRLKQAFMAIVKTDKEEKQDNLNFAFYTIVDLKFVEEEKTYKHVTINAEAAINHLEDKIVD